MQALLALLLIASAEEYLCVRVCCCHLREAMLFSLCSAHHHYAYRNRCVYVCVCSADDDDDGIYNWHHHIIQRRKLEERETNISRVAADFAAK
ncbi:hypothetical protein BDQ94DRAFT_135589 [Aspergillus welwitschiae]|uniref:Secreted protein n=1 Tax=Aspergillus welwitschiae TaxID=1341132 RepID=A0A3F3QGJ2_9EURO|nr:hypothetical protein BDQ94DRAFT_135589 [Aspergillus welwitschiae]RDH38059.1 hypothetical protein BDQ94DRAFT_135589 [Aspergillus welwitschiae]